MIKENNSEEVDKPKTKEKTNKDSLKEIFEHPVVKEEVDKVSEEKAKQMFLRKKIEDANDEVLMKDLASYSQLEKDDFKSIISQREKLLSAGIKASSQELEEYNNRLESARRVEKTFRMLEQRDRERISEDKPTMSTSIDTPPETLDEIEANPSMYKKYQIHENFYQTNDPHKEFKDHERSNLCSIYDDSCKEASETWYKEFVLSKNKNKKHIKNIKIL